LLKAIYPGSTTSFPGRFHYSNGTLYFGANSPAIGRELWKSDGTAAGTVPVADINIQTAGSFASPPTPISAGGKMFWDASSAAFGEELYVSDGDGLASERLTDIQLGPASSSIVPGAAAGGLYYFTAHDGTRFDLYKSDGTVSGTVKVPQSLLTFENFIEINGVLHFTARTSSNNYGIYRTDGATVTLVASLAGTPASTPKAIYTGGAMYFVVASAAHGFELWRSDLTQAGTGIVKDIAAGTANANPDQFAVLGTEIYFRATTSALGTELYKTDGTSAGTVLIKDIYPGAFGPNAFSSLP